MHRCEDETGADTVDSHRRGQLQCHRTRQLDNTCLRGVVVSVEGVAHYPVGRAHVQDHATIARQHPSSSLLSDEEHPVEVDIHHPAPLLRRDIHKGLSNADPSVVDQHIHPAQHFIQFAEGACHSVGIRHVGADGTAQ